MSQATSTFSTLLASPMRVKLGPFLLFALGILIISMTFFVVSIGRPYIGVRLYLNDQGWAVQSVDANSVAGRAGIKAGDKPIGINGQVAEKFLERYKEQAAVFGVLFTELSVTDGRGQLKSVELSGNSASWQLWVEQIAWLIVSLIFWLTGFYVLLRKPGKAAALPLCLFGLVLGVALSANMAAAIGVPAALQAHIVASVIGPWLLLHFFLVLPDERAKLSNNPLIYLIYLPAVVTLILFPLFGWADGQPVLWFRSIRLLEYGIGFLAAAGIVIFNFIHTNSTKTKQQMKIVLIGSLAALFPLMVFNVLPSAIWRETNGFGILFVSFIPIGLGYAVVYPKADGY